MSSLKWPLIHGLVSLLKKKKSRGEYGHRYRRTQREDDVETQREECRVTGVMLPQAKEHLGLPEARSKK